LLGRAKGYIETKIGCESEAERRYRVQDFWVGHRSFEVFREKFAAECEKLERLLRAEGLMSESSLSALTTRKLRETETS
jgi:hypothetical protein